MLPAPFLVWLILHCACSCLQLGSHTTGYLAQLYRTYTRIAVTFGFTPFSGCVCLQDLSVAGYTDFTWVHVPARLRTTFAHMDRFVYFVGLPLVYILRLPVVALPVGYCCVTVTYADFAVRFTSGSTRTLPLVAHMRLPFTLRGFTRLRIATPLPHGSADYGCYGCHVLRFARLRAVPFVALVTRTRCARAATALPARCGSSLAVTRVARCTHVTVLRWMDFGLPFGFGSFFCGFWLLYYVAVAFTRFVRTAFLVWLNHTRALYTHVYLFAGLRLPRLRFCYRAPFGICVARTTFAGCCCAWILLPDGSFTYARSLSRIYPAALHARTHAFLHARFRVCLAFTRCRGSSLRLPRTLRTRLYLYYTRLLYHAHVAGFCLLLRYVTQRAHTAGAAVAIYRSFTLPLGGARSFGLYAFLLRSLTS